jgi:hypothetical protein
MGATMGGMHAGSPMGMAGSGWMGSKRRAVSNPKINSHRSAAARHALASARADASTSAVVVARPRLKRTVPTAESAGTPIATMAADAVSRPS